MTPAPLQHTVRRVPAKYAAAVHSALEALVGAIDRGEVTPAPADAHRRGLLVVVLLESPGVPPVYASIDGPTPSRLVDPPPAFG